MLADYLPGFLAAYTVMVVAVMSPGPAVAMLLGLGLSRGRGTAVIATLGIACGSATIGVLTLVGLNLLLETAAWTITAIRLAGSAYLMWLAWRSLRKAMNPPELEPAKMPPLAPGRAFMTGYLLQVTNPKAIVFWVAIVAVSSVAGAPVGIKATFLAGTFSISLAGHMFYALALSSAPARAVYLRARRGVEATLGVLFAYFAVKLATNRV